jgi:hypothetical protein
VFLRTLQAWVQIVGVAGGRVLLVDLDVLGDITGLPVRLPGVTKLAHTSFSQRRDFDVALDLIVVRRWDNFAQFSLEERSAFHFNVGIFVQWLRRNVECLKELAIGANLPVS